VVGIAVSKWSSIILKALKILKALFFIYTNGEIETVAKEVYKTYVKKHKFLPSIKK
jgi:hypothetical protein